ncbi:glycosyltransferase [Belnapia sp. T6]|uniref:Glycosyltransferase n=1 Tax=Belnapia mucosa TaxID=2804532 RepID=A0ABS1VBM9_9PROT|nr:glycosyltransferase [Belnapia mucosa]MBL6459084.1 glycosyltransferase [Belnapia mucosa]
MPPPWPAPVAVIIGGLGQGGSERQLYSFLAGCDRRRWEPLVFASGALGFWEAPIRALGIPVVLLQGNPLAKMRQFRTAVVAAGIRCFFSWSSYTNGYALALAGTGSHCIGSFRNAHFADLPHRLRRLWIWMSLAGLTAVVCNSAETQAQVARRCSRRLPVVFVPNAIEVPTSEVVAAWRDHWRKRLGLSPDTVLVLGAGRLVPQKCFSRFIDVIAQVLQRHGQAVHAVIAGEDYGCLAALQAHVAQLGLEGRIEFLGAVPDARELMAAADIFLLSSDYEGMPNVVLEAMAAGVPCVATPVNGLGGVIESGASGVVAEADASDLARHVARLAADPGLRQAMGARGRALIATNHQPDRIVRGLWVLCEAQAKPIKGDASAASDLRRPSLLARRRHDVDR